MADARTAMEELMDQKQLASGGAMKEAEESALLEAVHRRVNAHRSTYRDNFPCLVQQR